MERTELPRALEIISSPDWDGSTIWAKLGTSEINIYQGINMNTFKSDGILYFDCVIYSEQEFAYALNALREAGATIMTKGEIKDSKGETVFYNINAQS